MHEVSDIKNIYAILSNIWCTFITVQHYDHKW